MYHNLDQTYFYGDSCRSVIFVSEGQVNFYQRAVTSFLSCRTPLSVDLSVSGSPGLATVCKIYYRGIIEYIPDSGVQMIFLFFCTMFWVLNYGHRGWQDTWQEHRSLLNVNMNLKKMTKQWSSQLSSYQLISTLNFWNLIPSFCFRSTRCISAHQNNPTTVWLMDFYGFHTHENVI